MTDTKSEDLYQLLDELLVVRQRIKIFSENIACIKEDMCTCKEIEERKICVLNQQIEELKKIDYTALTRHIATVNMEK